MNKKIKIGAIIQSNASSLYRSKNPANYCIDICKKSNIFDEIIMAVPDLPESEIFDKVSKSWDVKLVKGSTFNIAQRLLKASKIYNIDIIVRLILRRFYLDLNLVKSMIDLLILNKADYVLLSHDFNYELAGDVFTKEALLKAEKLAKRNPNKDFYLFSPWQLMEEDKVHFNSLIHPGSEDYHKSKVLRIKRKLSKLMDENQVQYGWNFPASSYAFLYKFLKKDDTCLDIACGQGEGARQIAPIVKKLTGVDLDKKYIKTAQKQHRDISNLEFIQADAMKFKPVNKVDVIISSHTLEHLPNPFLFLKICRGNLAKNGTLFLEVPILLPRPLGVPLYPFHKFEFNKEQLDTLLKKAGFKIIRKFGRSRGVYTKIENAREAIQYHCTIT